MVLWLMTVDSQTTHLLLVVLVISLVTTHYQIFLCLLQAEWPHWLVAFVGDVYVRHVLALVIQTGDLAQWLRHFVRWVRSQRGLNVGAVDISHSLLDLAFLFISGWLLGRLYRM